MPYRDPSRGGWHAARSIPGMTAPIALYLSMTIGLAALVVLHAAQVNALARRGRLWPDRAWAVLPGLATVVAWREGARALPVAFVATGLGYGLLWALRAA